MKRLDKRGCDITGLFGLYDEDDTIIDPGCYVCLYGLPVSPWEPEDDPWADHYDQMMKQLREALDWIGGDWLADAIWEYIDDATWAVIVEHDLEERLREAIDRMIDANESWIQTYTGKKITRKLQSQRTEIERLKAELEESAREESEALTQVERYSVEVGRLEAELADARKEIERKDVVAERDKIRLVVADARKAALSLYTSLLAGFFRREHILKSALEKWPWLGISEPPPAKPQGCSDGNCLLRIEPVTGQHTNGGCRCLRAEVDRLRLKAVDLGGQVVSQAEEIERLRAEQKVCPAEDKEEVLVNFFRSKVREIIENGFEGWVGVATLPDGERWRIDIGNLTTFEANRRRAISSQFEIECSDTF